jgi:hypothetical protein
MTIEVTLIDERTPPRMVLLAAGMILAAALISVAVFWQ